MRRNNRGSKLLAALLVLAMLLCSFPMVYAEDAAVDITAAELQYIPETEPESVMAEAEPAAEPELIEIPEEEPAAEPEPIAVPEEEPEADLHSAEVPEAAPAEESEQAETPEEELVQEPEAAETAEEESTAEAEPEEATEEEQEPATEAEPVKVPEEEPAAEADPVEIPEEMPEASEPETEAEIEADADKESEAESEEDADEETSEDTLYEFDDDEVGSVSEELLEIFNNPDTYEKIEFTGSVDIVLKNSEICYDRDVTLVARVSGADMDYRLVWEANDGSGWFAVASGHEYTFLLTPDIVNREYRVVLFRVC